MCTTAIQNQGVPELTVVIILCVIFIMEHPGKKCVCGPTVIAPDLHFFVWQEGVQ